MKKALLAITAVALSASAFAQGTAAGRLLFRTAQIQNAAATANYDVPLFQSNEDNLQGQTYVGNGNSVNPAGTLAGGVRIGLFTAGSTTPFFTSVMGTTGTGAKFAVNPATATIDVPGSTPGQQVPLTIRAWSGASFAAAQTIEGENWGEWTFTTKPLGGDTGSGTPTTPPTMTGWGPETGAGYELNETHLVPEPSTIALGVLGVGALALMRRRK